MQEACQCLIIPVMVSARPTSKSNMDVNIQNGVWGTEQINSSQLCMMQMNGSGITVKGVCHIYLCTYFYTYINIHTCFKI